MITIYFQFYCCTWKNGERMSSSARFFAALLKGFRFRHHKRSIPLLKLLLWSVIESIFCLGLGSASLSFFVCLGEGVLGSTNLTLIDLSRQKKGKKLLKMKRYIYIETDIMVQKDDRSKKYIISSHSQVSWKNLHIIYHQQNKRQSGKILSLPALSSQK